MEGKINTLEQTVLSLQAQITKLTMENAELKKKVDGLLDGKLSTPFEKDFVSTAEKISEAIDRRNKVRWKNL